MTISAEEIAAWHKLYDETQEALQRIGDEFGVLAGEERTSGIRRVLTEQRARIAALEAQLAERDEHVRTLETEIKRTTGWLDRLTDGCARKASESRFETMKEAFAADAKNYRAISSHLKASIIRARSKQEGK